MNKLSVNLNISSLKINNRLSELIARKELTLEDLKFKPAYLLLYTLNSNRSYERFGSDLISKKARRFEEMLTAGKLSSGLLQENVNEDEGEMKRIKKRASLSRKANRNQKRDRWYIFIY